MTLDTVDWLRDQGQLLLDAGSQFEVFNGVRLIASAAEIERLRDENKRLTLASIILSDENDRLRDENERLTDALQVLGQSA